MNKNALPAGRAPAPNSQLASSVQEREEARLLRATALDEAFALSVESTLEEWSSASDDATFKDL